MNRLAVVLFIIVGLLALGPCVFREQPERPVEGERAAEPVSRQPVMRLYSSHRPA